MANPARNEIEIKLGSNTYKLRATFEAIAEMEDYLNCSLGEILLAMPYGKTRMSQLKAIIMFGCVGANFKYDETKLEEDLLEAGIANTTQAVAPFLSQAFKGVPMPTTIEKKAKPTT